MPPQSGATKQHYFTPAWGLELLLTTAVCIFLFKLAEPLALPGADLGLHQRYGALPGPLDGPMSWSWLQTLFQIHTWDALPRDLRAVTVLRTGSYWFALLGGVGWLALQLARTGTVWAAGLMFALWVGLAWLLRPFQLPGAVWLGAATVAMVVTVLALPLWPWCTGKLAPVGRINVFTASVWPGWVLFPAISCVIALDFAARGALVPGGMAMLPPQPGARYLGLRQIDGLWAASGVFLLCVYFRKPLLHAWVGFCNALAALWQRPRGPAVLGLVALCCALFLAWLGYFQKELFLGIPHLKGGGKPHISGEVLRLSACAALAWFGYRVGEWRASSQRVWLSLRGLLLVVLICALGLWLSDDKGPLLVLALSLPVLFGVPLLQRLQGKVTVLMMALGGCIATLGLWRVVLIDWLPMVSPMARLREFMRSNMFEAYSPNLAQATWLMEAAPVGGFGLGRVPYCGAKVLAEQGACSLGSGAMLQMPLDFAYAPIAATFGTLGAATLVCLLLFWLFILPAGQLANWHATATGASYAPATTLALLPVWLIAIPCLVAQAQVVVSLGATLSWSSLAGVTLPLLGFGSTAMCATAIWVGLSAHGAEA